MVKKTSKKITILFLTLLVFTTTTNISLARKNHWDIPFEFRFGKFQSRLSTDVSAIKTDKSSVYVKNTGNARFYVSEVGEEKPLEELNIVVRIFQANLI